MNVADLELGSDSFSFLSPAHDSTSWLDHIITTRADLIYNIDILHHLCIFDHFPLRFDLKFEVSTIEEEQDNETLDSTNWKNFNCFQREIHEIMDSKFDEKILNNMAFCCDTHDCNDPSHKSLIDFLTDYLIESLLQSTSVLSSQVTVKFKPVPGWNTICKEKYTNARVLFLQWKERGMVRDGPDYVAMKASRAEFKSALRLCRENESSIRETRTINSFENKDFKTFWREISVKNNLKNRTIDNVTEDDKISELFAEKFFRVLNDENCQKKSSAFNSKSKDIDNSQRNPHQFLFKDIVENISKLNPGKDFDEINTNHLQFATSSTILFIMFLFNSMLHHSHIPRRLLKGKIRPEIKNKLGKNSDSDNFRPVMISSNLLKLFEYCLQPFLERALTLHDNQFGFREGTSTQMAISVVKEVVEHYNSNKSKVYACFLDLSKGFDKVNHFKLLESIWETNLGNNFKQIIKEFLLNQNAYVGFNNSISQMRRIGNGVRQGGVNSPLLFNFYLSKMIRDICSSEMGCKLGLQPLPIVAFADDLVALAPTQSALQFLLNKICSHLNQLDLTVNPTKTKVMVFSKGRSNELSRNINLYIGSSKLEVVQSYKYLGVIMSYNLNNSLDVQRLARAFLRQAFACMHKFEKYPANVKLFLFQTYCMSFYGSELWTDLKGCHNNFSSLEINFHKFIKRILGLPIRSSNHSACIAAEMQTFKHIRNSKMFNFIFQLKRTNSPCFKKLKNFFLFRSNLIKNVNLTANNIYGISDVLDNDQSAIKSRVNFVFMREPRYEGYTPAYIESNPD